jgi:two-component system response regulator AtoC
VLVLVSSASGVVTVPLPAARRVIIGRGSDCDVVIEDDSVSRRHAAIHVGPPLAIEDLGSRNGSAVAGRRLHKNQRVGFAVGCVVEIGCAAVVLQRELETPIAPAPPAAAASRGAKPRRDKKPAAPEVVVVDPTMMHLYALLDVVGPSALPLLLIGEVGSGKETFARTAHARSGLSGDFVLVAGGGLTESALDAALASATGGTLFIDDAGELPKATQAKLVRTLDDHAAARAPSAKRSPERVRIIAATGADLAELEESRALHEGLESRLSGFAITLPPLRKRKTDIAAMARAFLTRTATRLGVKTSTLSPKTVVLLEAYAWPGNVPELASLIERAVVKCRGAAKLDPEHLAFEDGVSRVEPPPPPPPPPEAPKPIPDRPRKR